jgi:hypothetical protein
VEKTDAAPRFGSSRTARRESAANLRFFHADGTEYGGSSDATAIDVMGRAYGGLRSMGFGETEAKRALAAVRAHVGRAGTAEDVVLCALSILTDGIGATG